MIILHKTIAEPPGHYTFGPSDIGEIKYIHEGCASEIHDAFQSCLRRDFADHADLNRDLRDLIKKVAADVYAREFLFDRIKEGKPAREVYNKIYLCLKQFVYFNKADIGSVSDIPASHVNSLREMLQILSDKLSSEEVKSDAEEDPQINAKQLQEYLASGAVNSLQMKTKKVLSKDVSPLSSKDKSEIENTFERESFKSKKVLSKVSFQSGGEIRFKRYDSKLKEATSRNSPPTGDQYITKDPSINSTRLRNELLGYLASKQEEPMKTPLAEKMLGRFKRDSDRWSREFAGEVGAAAKGLMDKFSRESKSEDFSLKKFIQDLNKDKDVHVRAMAKIMKSGSGSFFISPESYQKFKEKLSAFHFACSKRVRAFE